MLLSKFKNMPTVAQRWQSVFWYAKNLKNFSFFVVCLYIIIFSSNLSCTQSFICLRLWYLLNHLKSIAILLSKYTRDIVGCTPWSSKCLVCFPLECASPQPYFGKVDLFIYSLILIFVMRNCFCLLLFNAVRCLAKVQRLVQKESLQKLFGDLPRKYYVFLWTSSLTFQIIGRTLLLQQYLWIENWNPLFFLLARNFKTEQSSNYHQRKLSKSYVHLNPGRNLEHDYALNNKLTASTWHTSFNAT